MVAHSDEALEVSGAFGDGLAVCAPERGRVYRFQNTHSPALRFRVLLTEEGRLMPSQDRKWAGSVVESNKYET